MGVRFIIEEAYGAMVEAVLRGNTFGKELGIDDVRGAVKGIVLFVSDRNLAWKKSCSL